jgi:cellobiose phosphorylase
MIHAILTDMFSPQQARHHFAVIEQHLLGPDGARLFDRPMAYRGGLQRLFQRAETSSFFGREIGLMYTHAHLRYAEALWRCGNAEGFFRALCQAVPINLGDRLPCAARRQANCYYSSSDAAFADRYQAYDEYERVRAGEVALDGGWRIYSSGPGIATALIFRCFLGLRAEATQLVIDPVIPLEANGLQAALNLAGIRFEITYQIESKGCGVLALELNGQALPFTPRRNPYRAGGADVRMEVLRAHTEAGPNHLTVWLA